MVTPPAADAALFQALVESCADVFALVDTNGTFLYVTPSVQRVLGYTPEERLGQSGTTLIHEDDRHIVSERFARVLASPGVPFRYTCRVRHKDGTWRHIESTAVNRLNEALGGIIINYRDVTKEKHAEEALRRSERQYRSLIQGALYGIYRTTVDGRIVDANPAFARMLGYDSVEDLEAVNMREIYARPEEREAIIREARASGKRQLAVTVNWKRKDGSPIVARVTARLVEIDASGVSCFEGIVEDVTEKRRLDEQLRQSQKMEAVGRLARGIAHDFNNVLAAILGNADLIQLQIEKDDPLVADLGEITAAAERGAALTRQLLAFSRPRQGVEPRLLEMHAVLNGIDHMLQRLSGDIEMRLEMHGPSASVRIGPGQVEQIVMNLVLNAREAVSEGGLIEVMADTVTLDTAAAARFPGIGPGRYARIRVRDNGAGIADANQAHVFEPFFSTKDPSTGPGLGLAIVYGIAKDAGGAVGFTSTPGAGTTFEVLLPAV